MNTTTRMPPITRSQQDDHDKATSGKKKDDKKHRLKKGGRGGHDDDSVDSHGNIRGLIDYEYESEISEDEPPAKEKRQQKSQKPQKNNKRNFELSTDCEDDDAQPNFKKFGKNSSTPTGSSKKLKNQIVKPKESRDISGAVGKNRKNSDNNEKDRKSVV